MSKRRKSVIIQPVQSSRAAISEKAMLDAADDAVYLMTESKVIPKLVAVDIVARQLFLLIRHGLEQEVKNGWDVERPDLVLQTLGVSAQEKAVNTPVVATELRKQLLELVLPVVDIFCQMETNHDEQSEVIPGCDRGSQEQLGTVLQRTSGDTGDEARERGKGDRRETGEA